VQPQADERSGEGPAHDECPVGGTGEAVGELGQRPVGEVPEQAFPAGPDDLLQGPVGQVLVVTDDLVDRLAADLAVGHGDALDGVLQLHAGGLEPFGQVGAVEQLEGRDRLAAQPLLQHLGQHVAGVRGVEIVRGEAARRHLPRGSRLVARGLGVTAGHDDRAVEAHRSRIQGLPGHLDAYRAPVGQQLPGRLDRLLLAVAGLDEVPARQCGLAEIDLVVNLTGH
jgi:hypothetical protein